MPAAPTRSEIETAWKNAINLLDQTYRYGGKNPTNFLGLLDTMEQSLEGEFVFEAVQAAQSIRSSLAGTVSRAAAQALFRPFLQMYCRHVIGRTDLTSDEAMLSEFYQYFVDNNYRVQSRAFTFGTPTAVAGNIGTTQIVRLTRDRYNFDIESGHIDSKRATCVLDANTGAGEGQEVWFFEGQSPSRDDLYRSGSGAFGTLAGLSADDSLLNNADFRNFGNTAAAPDDITDWTADTAVSSATFEFDNNAANRYRIAPSNSSANAYSLVVKATNRISQKLTVRGTELDPNVPYLLAVIWNREIGGASGTLVLRMGNTANSISVAAQTGWQVSFAPPSAGWSNWYRVFAENDLALDVDWTRTGGNLYIAEALLVPGNYLDGSWYWVLPSSAAAWIPPRINDRHNIVDIATDAVIQRSLAFAWQDFYLPSSVGSSITWPDPS
jgi:hypothetical protein